MKHIKIKFNNEAKRSKLFPQSPLKPSGFHLIVINGGIFLFGLRRLLFLPVHSSLIIHKLFFTHTSAYCPTPSTFNNIQSAFKYGSVSTLHFKLPGYTLSAISLGCINGGMPGKGIKLGEKMHSKTPMGQFIPAVLFLLPPSLPLLLF